MKNNSEKVLVGLLIIVNVVLIAALAVRQRRLQTSAILPAATSPAVPQATADPAFPSGNGKHAEPSPSVEKTPSSGTTPRRLLAANSEEVAWRADPGGCHTPATVEVTTDGGKSWRATDPGIRAIVRLKAFGTDAVFAIGADARCHTTYAWIEGPNQQWQRDASQISDKWYRVPSDPNLIHDATGKTSTPCGDGVSDLAGLGTYKAAVLCNDGRIRTRDEGRGWQTVERKSDAVALNADDSQFVAAIKDPSCIDGLVVRMFDADGTGLSSDAGNCRKAPSQTNAAVSNIYTKIWIWSGKKVSVGG